VIITNSAGCGSHMKDYADLLKDDPEYAEPARAFAAATRDVTEYLAQVGLREARRPRKARIAYQDACHLAHAQRIRSAPRELLRFVGAEVVELPHPDQCCGSAGTYNVAQNDLSMQILGRKMDDVGTVADDIQEIATANTGCMLQMQAGVRDRKWPVRVRHIVDILNDCY
jgi:glycolate oxidase iron-sulfur subunit